MAEENKRIKTPEIRTAKTPNTVIKKDIVSLLTCKNILPKSLTKVMGGHEKSPLALKKPTTPNSFKHPQMMSSKIPQPASLKSNKLFSSNPQFSHIVSPIGRYIKNTPAIPLKKAVKLNYYDGGISKLYNSRDSDVSFKENYDETNSAEALVALPRRGKIGTIKKQVRWTNTLIAQIT